MKKSKTTAHGRGWVLPPARRWVLPPTRHDGVGPSARILPDDVRSWLRKLQELNPEIVEEARRNEDAATFCRDMALVAATYPLLVWLGAKWVGKHPDPITPHPFLADRPGAFGESHFEARVIELAEMLFNMQDVPGFGARMEQLRSANLDGAIAELQGAQWLHQCGVPFEFIDTKSGETYDVAARIDNLRVPVEMKSGSENAKPTRSSIRKRIYEKRKRLPKDGPSVVMIRVPAAWVASEASYTEIRAGIAEAFRTSKRFSAVVVHWETWQSIEGGDVRGVAAKCFDNDSARTKLRPMRDIMRPSIKWVRMLTLACTEEELLAAGWRRGLF